VKNKNATGPSILWISICTRVQSCQASPANRVILPASHVGAPRLEPLLAALAFCGPWARPAHGWRRFFVGAFAGVACAPCGVKLARCWFRRWSSWLLFFSAPCVGLMLLHHGNGNGLVSLPA
jgi:hypothetical protein